MGFYDTIVTKEHTAPQRWLLLSLNRNVVRHILSFFPEGSCVSLLEIGPGKGYFAQACCEGDRVEYHAFDRNRLILERLGIERVYLGDASELPRFDRQFDVIYAAYVIEHLENGKQLFEFIRRCRENLKPNGVVVLFAPDAVRTKFEFWNMDYTHIFPTTKRNVAMAMNECGLSEVAFTDVHGLLTHPFFTNRLINGIVGAAVWLYSYRFWAALAYPFYRKSFGDLSNVFCRAYCVIKQQNMMVTARVPAGQSER